MNEDRRVLQCNYTETTNIAPQGARAYLVSTNRGNGNDRVEILVRSHSGRWVEKYERIDRLENWRVKTLPPRHPLYSHERLWDYQSPFDQEVLVSLNRAHARERMQRIQKEALKDGADPSGA